MFPASPSLLSFSALAENQAGPITLRRTITTPDR
jgi:hypothetical protein